MCGINGIVGLTDNLIAKEKIIAMNTNLSHRGPNDEGNFVDEKIALGHRRLSIIDLSAAGHQPMTTVDGRYTIVYNGELYNFIELKFELQRVVSGSKLPAFIFQTNTDTEVVLASYIRWGNACLNQFNGMFAFAIWDAQTKELFVARDRLGIKPLYYFYSNGILAFSSEIRALMSANLIQKKIDEHSLVDYLRYQTVHAPNTIIKGIKMLMPGHFLEMKNSELRIKKYWSVEKNISEDSNNKTYTEVCNDVNSLLTNAVERRLIADVPFGAFLSGGIDSSAIVGLMTKVSTEKVKTFSVTFDESEFSEAKYAQLISKKFNTEHHEIKLKPLDFIKELPNALKAMDHPSGDGPNTFVVSKATKQAGITMALSGLGGDELFAGYDVFKYSLALKNKKWLNNVPHFIRTMGGKVMLYSKNSIANEKKTMLLRSKKIEFNSFYPLSRQVLMDSQIEKILQNNLLVARQEKNKNSVAEIINDFHFPKNNYQISLVSAAEISTYMQNVLLRDTDQMSMAHALEVRVPFLDYTLVEYVLGIADKFKNPITPKKLLVDSLGDLLPSEIVNRPKMGFTLPFKDWMKNELNSFCEQKIISLSKRSLFNENGVINLWKEFLNNNPRYTWSRIWYLVVLENWLQQNDVE